MAIHELGVFPQITYSETQGQIGTRRWSLDWDDDIDAFVAIVANSAWPEKPDCIPVQIQSGPFWDEAQIKRNSALFPRTRETLGTMPQYNKYLVQAQYALHRMTNCWPCHIPKPWHPPGTTLDLKIRGSGQMLLVSPAGIRAISPLLQCTEDARGIGHAMGTRILIPITEYHIRCDRMTWEQVDSAMEEAHWDAYEGTVNTNLSWSSPYWFLGKHEGTLLFDGYEITESFACHPTEPTRFAMTACIKHRNIITPDGCPRYDDDGVVVGWNHDFINRRDADGEDSKHWGWKYIKMLQGNDGTCAPRYSYRNFAYMFGAAIGDITERMCGAPDGGDPTTLSDCGVCLNNPAASSSGEVEASSAGECGDIFYGCPEASSGVE